MYLTLFEMMNKMLTRTSANRTHEAQPRAGGFFSVSNLSMESAAALKLSEMNTYKLTSWSVVIILIAIYSCNPPETMRISHQNAIGTYVCNARHGVEILVLEQDSTYIYEIRDINGEYYIFDGRWCGPVKYTRSNVPGLAFVFYEWPIDYMLYQKSFSDYEENRRKGRKIDYQIQMVIKRVDSEWTYVLERSPEFTGTDFIKQRQ